MKYALLFVFIALPAWAQSNQNTAGHVAQSDADLNSKMEKCRVDTNVAPTAPTNSNQPAPNGSGPGVIQR